MKSTRRRYPKPIPFVVTGAIIGFIVFSVISWLGPNSNEGYNISYDPGAALGLMSVLGLFVGGFVGLVVAALLAGRR